MNIDDLVKNFGDDETEPNENYQRWYDLIQPATVNIILGRKGTGKSALGYFLLETIGTHYNLSPFIVNLPKTKEILLPTNFAITNLERVKTIMNSIYLIDEGTTMLPAGQAKLEEMVKAFQALSRQRNQIIIFIFHASSDVGSRILRGIDAVLLKEPSKRQIQHGSKDNWWHDLLLEAKGKFKTIKDMGEDKRKYTYIDSEEPEFRGLMANSLCSFWSEDLSCAYAGVVEREGDRLVVASNQLELSPEVLRERIKAEGLPDPYWNNVKELQKICHARGLPTTGNKDALVIRLFGMN